MAAVREHFEGRTEVFEEEYRVRRKDGSCLWILDRGKAVRDAAGQVVRMAGSEINLTERKQIEAKLTQQLALNQTILNTTPGFLVLKDRNSVYVDVNLAFCQFLGKPREGIIGKTDLDLFPPQDAAMYIAGDSAVIETGSPESEDWLVSGEEQKRWLRVTKNAVRDADGKINGVLCSVTDITERKRAEEELRQRYAQLERWHHATVGREVRMIELKQEINSLCRAAGLPERYAAKTPAELTLPDSGPATTSNEQGEVS
jgi:PAS domain S-box-containing protein